MEELVELAKSGNKEAFDNLVTDNISYMYKMGYTILKNDDEISDAIQNTIIKIYRNIQKLEKNGAFKSWMITILINECKDIRKKETKNSLFRRCRI